MFSNFSNMHIMIWQLVFKCFLLSPFRCATFWMCKGERNIQTFYVPNISLERSLSITLSVHVQLYKPYFEMKKYEQREVKII